MYFEFKTYKTGIRVEKRADVPGFEFYEQTQENLFFPTTENWNLNGWSTDGMPFSLERVLFFPIVNIFFSFWRSDK